MKKWIIIVAVGILFSLFYFPITFSFLPSTNTKNLLGAVGIVIVLGLFVYRRELILPKEILILLILSAFVSLISLFSIIFNHTPDDSYVSYIRAVVIWLSGAVTICTLIYLVHGRVDVPLIINYMTAVCFFQCVSALLIEFVPAFGNFIDTYVLQGQEDLHDMDRLYGIGAALDVAGSRFAAAVAALAILVYEKRESLSIAEQMVYLTAFVFITIVGNMIARTTSVGVGIGILYIGVFAFRNLIYKGESIWKLFGVAIATLLLLIPISVFLYRVSPEMQDLFRFGFEGFFNLVEKGSWSAGSTEMLKEMVVFPETLKTWIIGDGYFMNSRYDINYLGDATEGGYYMGTDIGYLRFIFYFGVIGLFAISAVMIYSAYIGASYFAEYQWVPIVGCIINFIVWLKVSTDLFPFIVLFVAAVLVMNLFPPKEEEEEETEILEE